MIRPVFQHEEGADLVLVRALPPKVRSALEVSGFGRELSDTGRHVFKEAF